MGLQDRVALRAACEEVFGIERDESKGRALVLVGVRFPEAAHVAAVAVDAGPIAKVVDRPGRVAFKIFRHFARQRGRCLPIELHVLLRFQCGRDVFRLRQV